MIINDKEMISIIIDMIYHNDNNVILNDIKYHEIIIINISVNVMELYCENINK